VSAKDNWNGTATMTFGIITGVKPNNPPLTRDLLESKVGFVRELFYYKFPPMPFSDPDGDQLFYVVSQEDGNYLPSWLNFEDFTMILSGIPNPADPLQNVTEVTQIVVLADDRRGGTVSQRFNITLMKITADPPNFQNLVIVGILTGAFVLLLTFMLCKKVLKCRRKRARAQRNSPETATHNHLETDEDSLEDEDILAQVPSGNKVLF
jgi:hypothetical protein